MPKDDENKEGKQEESSKNGPVVCCEPDVGQAGGLVSLLEVGAEMHKR